MFLPKIQQDLDALRRGADIAERWTRASPLFNFVSYDFTGRAGCLTMIRDGSRNAVWGEHSDRLTISIRQDERIPKVPEDIRDSSLVVFAQWQDALERLRRGLISVEECIEMATREIE